MLEEAFKRVALVGAGGKMGRGIALLLLQEMARLRAERRGQDFRLYLLDSNAAALQSLRPYLRTQMTRFAERNINALRRSYSDVPFLVSNGEIITAFVTEALDSVHEDTDPMRAASASLIFEAIVEDIQEKQRLFEALASRASKSALFFSNTSSIPIHLLQLPFHHPGRLVGFHFYNPPAVQKLVELILPEGTPPEVAALSWELAERLNKQVVLSRDVAGFIGNGHFMREVLFACQEVRELSRDRSLPEALYMVNKVTQDFLIRPMGLFQLIDFVGLDICQHIGAIMSRYGDSETLFEESLIDEMVAEDLLGGQLGDGSPKNGFFAYTGSERQALYSIEEHAYIPLKQELFKRCDQLLGPFPEGHASWKHLQRDPEKGQKLRHYLHNLLSSDTVGASLAQAFLNQSRATANQLVANGTAASLQDVDTVLKLGFYHLYGPHSAEIPAREALS